MSPYPSAENPPPHRRAANRLQRCIGVPPCRAKELLVEHLVLFFLLLLVTVVEETSRALLPPPPRHRPGRSPPGHRLQPAKCHSQKPPDSMSSSAQRLRQVKNNLPDDLGTGWRTVHFYSLREKCEKPHQKPPQQRKSDQLMKKLMNLVLGVNREDLRLRHDHEELEWQRVLRHQTLLNPVMDVNLEDLRHLHADLYLECQRSARQSAAERRKMRSQALPPTVPPSGAPWAQSRTQARSNDGMTLTSWALR